MWNCLIQTKKKQLIQTANQNFPACTKGGRWWATHNLTRRLSQRLFNEFIIFHERITPHNREQGVHIQMGTWGSEHFCWCSLLWKLVGQVGNRCSCLVGNSTMHLCVWASPTDWVMMQKHQFKNLPLSELVAACFMNRSEAIWMRALIPLWWGALTMQLFQHRSPLAPACKKIKEIDQEGDAQRRWGLILNLTPF